MSDNPFERLNISQQPKRMISCGEYEPAILSVVKLLDFRSKNVQNIERGGCIFFTIINDEFYICLGRDKRSGDLTDFGGRRKKKRNENIIQCAIREANEESNCAFGLTSINVVQEFKVLYNSQMLIIFIPVKVMDNDDIISITMDNFTSGALVPDGKNSIKHNDEISELVWCCEKDINDMLSSWPKIRIYDKVRRFIRSFFGNNANVEVMKSIFLDLRAFSPSDEGVSNFQRNSSAFRSACGGSERESRQSPTTSYQQTLKDHLEKNLYC